jgi:hypothetical protein
MVLLGCLAGASDFLTGGIKPGIAGVTLLALGAWVTNYWYAASVRGELLRRIEDLERRLAVTADAEPAAAADRPAT